MNFENLAAAALLGMADNQQTPRVVETSSDRSSESGRKRTIDDDQTSDETDFCTNRQSPRDILGEEKEVKRHKKTHEVQHSYPVKPRVFQVCTMPKTHVDHSYKDFSQVPPEPGYEPPREISDMTFAQKLHHMLSKPEYSGMISWVPHGRAFRILSPKQLEESKVLQMYFGHSRYSRFLTQLKNHGLKNFVSGKNKGCYYHQVMLRGLPHLCKYMPQGKTGRKLLPDPKNEPDFETLSTLWPLPGDPEEEKQAATTRNDNIGPPAFVTTVQNINAGQEPHVNGDVVGALQSLLTPNPPTNVAPPQQPRAPVPTLQGLLSQFGTTLPPLAPPPPTNFINIPFNMPPIPAPPEPVPDVAALIGSLLTQSRTPTISSEVASLLQELNALHLPAMHQQAPPPVPQQPAPQSQAQSLARALLECMGKNNGTMGNSDLQPPMPSLTNGTFPPAAAQLTATTIVELLQQACSSGSLADLTQGPRF